MTTIRWAAAFLAAFTVIGACNQAPAPAQVSVPYVIGLPVVEAEAMLKSDGLSAKASVETPCPACPGVSQPPAVVNKQTPASGTKVRPGTVVELGYPCVC